MDNKAFNSIEEENNLKNAAQAPMQYLNIDTPKFLRSNSDDSGAYACSTPRNSFNSRTELTPQSSEESSRDSPKLARRRRSSVFGIYAIPPDDDEEGEGLIYKVDDVPPWYMCLFLGFQHYLEMIGASIACPFMLTPALCMADDDSNKANIISTLIFMSGIVTILQSHVGSRLPIVQGGSFSYLVPTLAIMNLPQWKCPPPEVMAGLSPDEKTELWQVRMREIQGAIIVAALIETLFAVTGAMGYLVRYLTPLTVAPAITLIGLSLFKDVTKQVSKNPIVAFAMIGLLVLFSQHFKNFKFGNPFAKKKDADGNKIKREKFPIFQVFPVLLALAIVWGACIILTITDVLPKNNPARADAKIKILQGAPWFRIPYPFQWGWPTVSVGAVIGVLCGALTTVIESLGDYYACAAISKMDVPPTHAINRGIFIEGFGCVISGIFGSGNGSTSYSNNIGTITITKVASRRVILFGGVIMIILGLIGKAGAIFIGIPDPVLGGLFCYIFPLIMAVGIGTLSEICLESSRNIFIVSFSIFAGLAVSQWAEGNPEAIDTGSAVADSVLQILLSTGMFVAGIAGFILDNTIPGTQEERGLAERKEALKSQSVGCNSTYDLPYITPLIQRFKIFRWFPLSPTYRSYSKSCLPRSCSRTALKKESRGNNLSAHSSESNF